MHAAAERASKELEQLAVGIGYHLPGVAGAWPLCVASLLICSMLMSADAHASQCLLQLREHPENLNSNPLLMALGTIFLVWLVFGFSVWYAFYATLLAGIAGGLTLLTGKQLSYVCCCPEISYL